MARLTIIDYINDVATAIHEIGGFPRANIHTGQPSGTYPTDPYIHLVVDEAEFLGDQGYTSGSYRQVRWDCGVFIAVKVVNQHNAYLDLAPVADKVDEAITTGNIKGIENIWTENLGKWRIIEPEAQEPVVGTLIDFKIQELQPIRRRKSG